jgi:hypothetical protein
MKHKRKTGMGEIKIIRGRKERRGKKEENLLQIGKSIMKFI